MHPIQINNNNMVMIAIVYPEVCRMKFKRDKKYNIYFSHLAYSSRSSIGNIDTLPMEIIPDTNDKRKIFYDYKCVSLCPQSTKTFEYKKFLSSIGITANRSFLTENNPYTFGVEIETSAGYVFSDVWSLKCDVKCVRDGSISAQEYVTLPLTGDNGMNSLQDIFFRISKFCKIDQDCGLHIHIGNMIFNKLNIIALYKICLSIENEIFNIMPYHRRDNDTCKRLKHFDELVLNDDKYDKIKKEYVVRKIYDFLFYQYHGEKFTDDRHNKNHIHEKGIKCGYDHKTMRYCWLNLQHAMMLCKTSNPYVKSLGTVEFRIHEGTLNYEMARNWILVCMGIIKYSENNASSIVLYNKMPNLEEILKDTYSQHCNYLLKYVKKREKISKYSEESQKEYFTHSITNEIIPMSKQIKFIKNSKYETNIL